ncbi:fatty acyl-CoA reductase 2, chloroplastic [Capsicum annuum]|uniref:fatty acyl-CoA reductase 2, chloroplastic n=1 Tax=Capsicum annuum TaxID=4072 RepID=UPI0007BFD795|nr:fatty acyl-CoA reductase 2, chloroplastic [Capsicum annuum]
MAAMGSLCSSSCISKTVMKLSKNWRWCPPKKVYCQTSGTKSGNVSSVVTERSSVISSETLGSLVLSPNAEIKVKDLVPYGQSRHDDGIGITKFLRGKAFLITGATGFLGKVLIEKILRTAPDVNKIFILIKAKNKEVAMQRLKNEILNADIFNCLKQVHGKSYQTFMLSKLVPLLGNVCEANLGIDEDTANMMAKEVDVIVNSAANTTFDERYDISLDINTEGPSRLMNFAKQCRNLKLFLQVSTAYVNGQRQGRIMEKAFGIGDSIARENLPSGVNQSSSPSLNVEDEIKLVLESKQGLEDNSVAQKMKEIGLRRANKFGWQDTYVFTKAMGEMMIDSMRGDIPVVIIRPSVIESTYKEPFPGWMEGSRMMDPIILYYGKGQLTGFLVDPNGVLDVVPADMVVNATLAAMAKHGTEGKPGSSSVYQVASSAVNPLVFKDLARMLFEHFNRSPYIDSKGRPIHVPKMSLLRSMEDLSSHLWRDAINRSGLTDLTDPNGKLSRKLENICRKSVEQAKYLANIYEPYTFYGGRFDNSNTQRLMECMSKEERWQFGFDVESIDWKDYISNVHIPGLRKHVMKGRGSCS